MIAEHEILEQLLEDDWTLSRSIAFLKDLRVDPWQIIVRHTQEQNLLISGANGDVLPDWKVQEILRNKEDSTEILVHCTEKGARLVT